MKYFEDYKNGLVFELGSHTFTKEEIIAFAEQYDPQPFHIDQAAAKQSHFSALCASGWHTVAIWMRKYLDQLQIEIDTAEAAGERTDVNGPSPGFTNLQWHRPVYAGDTITYRSTVTGSRESASRPEWGIVEMRNEGIAQDGRIAMSYDGKVFIRRRHPAGGKS